MAVEFFLKLDGVPGEAQGGPFKDQIQINSFSFGGTNLSTVGLGTGSGAGKVNLGPISFTKHPDKASVKLFVDMCTGTHIATAKLSAVKAGASQQAYLTLDMTEVFISSFTTSAATEMPVESVSLSYKSIQYTYYAQNPDGSVVASGVGGWDLAKNRKM